MVPFLEKHDEQLYSQTVFYHKERGKLKMKQNMKTSETVSENDFFLTEIAIAVTALAIIIALFA